MSASKAQLIFPILCSASPSKSGALALSNATRRALLSPSNDVPLDTRRICSGVSSPFGVISSCRRLASLFTASGPLSPAAATMRCASALARTFAPRTPRAAKRVDMAGAETRAGAIPSFPVPCGRPVVARLLHRSLILLFEKATENERTNETRHPSRSVALTSRAI